MHKLNLIRAGAAPDVNRLLETWVPFAVERAARTAHAIAWCVNGDGEVDLSGLPDPYDRSETVGPTD